ncbi:unnamed protein product [Oppiella nova]|uniref:Virilizer N-terminal domain-containing protein n=2 Tax=Oppiella nova TaxID=334625 RepID=A0A7R9M5S6_9ACAR|nr:unnamed protein product [Oppiella nova]CAG2171298.1 unnamed protein product [Oppiella nova]
MAEDFELLFFDTFSQTDGPDGPNLGLVQFPNPIIIKEIRVIPLGARVEADFPGGLRLGATNPSSFELEFFINDLTKGNACTFLDIGCLDYQQNVSIKFVPKELIPTDGLILRGMYSTLTLSVFGCIADISRIIADDTQQASDVVSDHVFKEETNFVDELPTDCLSISDSVCDRIDELKVNQIIKTLTETSDDSYKKRRSPTLSRKGDRHESRASSQCSDISDRRKRDKPIEIITQRTHHRFRDNKTHHNRKSSYVSKRKSRSRSKSKSRSNTPNSLKRRYVHRTPSSPFDKSPKRSPKRYYRSPPRRHRSPSVSSHSPLHSIKTISNSSLSPPSRPPSPSRHRSLTKSPLLAAFNRLESNDTKEVNKTEVKPIDDSLAFEDSELFEPLSPEDSLSEIAEKISDDENLDQIIGEDAVSDSQSKDDFEEISSEEEYEDFPSNAENDLLMDFSEYDLSSYSDFGAFNPFQCEFTALQSLRDPSLSNFDLSEMSDTFESANESKVIDLVNSVEDIRNDKWVEVVEQISIEINKCLIKDELLIKTLIDFVVDGIDFELAMKQMITAYKVRHMKAGIKLLIALSQTSEQILNKILDLNLTHTLLELYNRPYMTIPVRLLIIRGIDVICDWPSGVEHILDGKPTASQTCYQLLLDLLVEKPSTRIVVSLTSLLKKIHLFEILKYLSKACEEPNTEPSNEDSIAICLNEISMTYKNANNLLSQPFRSLPTTKQFEMKTSPYDSYKAVYKYFKRNNTVECLTSILSAKSNCSADAFDSALDLLNSLSNASHGLRFLLSCDTINSTNNLYKILTQQCDDSETPLQTIALKLIYRLQVLQLIDLIFGFHITHERSKTVTFKDNFDDPDLVATLHSLYTMLFTGIGRDAVVHVLTSETNFDAILPFICLAGDKEKESMISKLVSCGCALELCLVSLQLIDANLMTFLDSYGQILLKVCENESIPKLQAIANWLSPIKNVSYNLYTENTFKTLMSVIKKHYESVRDSPDNSLFTISPELITTLRILQTLCLPSESVSEMDIQLKYRYAIIEILSFDDFTDISPIPVLLRLYSVLALVPTSAPTQLLIVSIAQQIQYEISEILLIYTELYISGSESDEAINKSVWTKMAKHVIDYTLSSPLTFIHGLTLLSDVLPQPLPLLVKQPMLNHEVLKTVNFRKLWSLHLHVLNDRIEELVSNFITSNLQPIQILLKRVCIQLCDLSALTVTTVAKSIFDSLVSSLETFHYSTNDLRNVVICPTVRILNVIQDLSTNIPFRIGFVTHLRNSIQKEDKSAPILTRLQSVFNKTVQINSNEFINFILQPNADSDVLTPEVNNANTTDVNNKTENNSNETNVLNTESLSNYFANRSVFVLEDDPLVPEWLSVATDESEQIDSADAMKMDLIELSTKYFGAEFDIRANLEKYWSEPMSETQSKENDISEKTLQLPFIRNTPKENVVNLNKRMQGSRGRGRSFTRLNDPFRSRPPNTSRPPSMHVDDFVALERNDSNPKRTNNKEFIRQNNRGMNATMRSFGPNQRSSNGNTYRQSPSSARNVTDRYNSRDLYALSSNRVNKSDSNLPLRWTKIGANRYDFRYPQYPRSFNPR